MTQSHAQIKLTPNPINLEDVISFVSQKDLFTCSDSSTSNRQNNNSIAPNELEAQATMAKMELDDIINFAYEEFNISKIAIHYRLGAYSPDDTVIAFAISSTKQKDAEKACKEIASKLNGTSEPWKEKEITRRNN